MNDRNSKQQSMNRRSFLGKAATLGAIASIPIAVPWVLPGPAQASAFQWQPSIRSRSEWDEGHGPTGAIEAEDPRFLLVHHTAQPGNNYTAEDVPRLLRSMYWYHSGEEKSWPDIAYNFLVDQFGTIWEGRTGSITGPVRGSATGGNQGFSQLCCFIGNLAETDPTQAATDSMVDLLAWLAIQRNIDVSRGATVTFASRGSNKWPEGSEVITPTIAGHRDMSQTSCPGDRGYAFVTDRLPALVLAKVNEIQSPGSQPDATTTTELTSTTTASAAPPTTEPATVSSETTLSDTEPSSDSSSPSDTSSTSNQTALDAAASPSGTSGSSELGAAPIVTQTDTGSSSRKWLPWVAVGGVAAATAQGVAMSKRKPSPDPGPSKEPRP